MEESSQTLQAYEDKRRTLMKESAMYGQLDVPLELQVELVEIEKRLQELKRLRKPEGLFPSISIVEMKLSTFKVRLFILSIFLTLSVTILVASVILLLSILERGAISVFLGEGSLTILSLVFGTVAASFAFRLYERVEKFITDRLIKVIRTEQRVVGFDDVSSTIDGGENL